MLEDHQLIEKLANFHRERIPERVVHARGASAKGFFEVTHDISHLTCADVFRSPGAQCPVIVRFSTVIHERGSPETIRDPRGFAVKFYTRQGNWDLVGNNMPVFFVRDGMKYVVFCSRRRPCAAHVPRARAPHGGALADGAGESRLTAPHPAALLTLLHC